MKELKLNIRIKKELKDSLKKQAAHENRTVSGLVLHALRVYLQLQGAKVKAAVAKINRGE